jgi:hypothetical protein
MGCVIPLTQGLVAWVDDFDHKRASAFKWHAQMSSDGRRWYASRNTPAETACGKTTLQLHRFILSVPETVEIDHADGDGLNCRRQNLRPATRSQNQMNRSAQANNTSGFKGVTLNKRDQKWLAQINIAGKRTCIGRFNAAVEAALAYDQAAIAAFGEFAKLNFPRKVA